MRHSFAIAVAMTLAVWAAVPASAADSGAASAPMISKKAKGEVAIVPEAMLGGQLTFKVVAVNRTMAPAKFGPKNIHVFASGEPVRLMSLDQLIAQARGTGIPGAESYDASGLGGPTVSHNMAGQPNLDNFAGGDTSSGVVTVQRARGGSESAGVKREIASLRSAILHSVVIAPGALKGGEVVTRPIRLKPHGQHALRVQIDFNGEKHVFRFPEPPAQ